MSIKKAGSILVNMENRKIGLVYRKSQNDYSFPKGHLEEGESLPECAIRETEEETGRTCHLVSDKELGTIEYMNSAGEQSRVYIFLAIDDGETTKIINPKDKEQVCWVEWQDVENKLSYDNLKEFWNTVKDKIYE